MTWGFYHVLKPVYVEFDQSFAMKEFRQNGVYGTYKKHFFWFVDNLGHLAHLEDENEYLQGRVAILEKEKQVLLSHQAETEIAGQTKKLGESLKRTEGSELAVALQAIQYTVPQRLTTGELHTLALGYFRSKDWQKSVVIFEYLQSLKDSDQFRTANIDLMKGICWYHLKNYSLAKKNISHAKQSAYFNTLEHRHALLWEAMVHQAWSHREVAQIDLLKFLEAYPHSEEQRWINRSPASPPKHQKGAKHE